MSVSSALAMAVSTFSVKDWNVGATLELQLALIRSNVPHTASCLQSHAGAR